MFGSLAHGHAKSRYKMVSKKYSSPVDGDVRIASWSNDVNDDVPLFYGDKDANLTVENLDCSSDTTSKPSAELYVGSKGILWGHFLECESGPQLVLPHKNDRTSPPAIILWRDDDERYVIVEESSSHPSFLYSVWKSSALNKIRYAFHIESSMRLAEAVVTGIVHAQELKMDPTGGGCFSLLRQYSETNDNYPKNPTRAAPFGERPGSPKLDSLSEVETIEGGIGLNVNAIICGVWLVVVTLIGVAWSHCLHSSIGIDIYNRDELIRAVSVQSPITTGGPVSDIRIFVHKKGTGHLGVVISDSGEKRRSWFQFFDKKAMQVGPPQASANEIPSRGSSSQTTSAPSGRTFALGAMRMGMERPLPGRDGNYLYPTTASPVSSEVSLVGTPLPNLSILTPNAFNSSLLGERGISALFDESVSSTSFAGSVQRCGDIETGGARECDTATVPSRLGDNYVVTSGQGAVSACLEYEHCHEQKTKFSEVGGSETGEEAASGGAILQKGRKPPPTVRHLLEALPPVSTSQTGGSAPQNPEDK